MRTKLKSLRITTIGIVGVALIGLVGCSKELPPPFQPAPILSGNFVTLQPQGLGVLPSGFVYELWLFRYTNDGTQRKSLGKFIWNPTEYRARTISGTLIPNNRIDAGEDIYTWDRMVVTIEPVNDPAPAEPSVTLVYSGDIIDTVSTVAMRFPVNLASDNVTATYFLASASDGFKFHKIGFVIDSARQRNASFGIYFGDLKFVFPVLPRFKGDTLDTIPFPLPSLNIPALPQGWQYEGWISWRGKLLSTGKFARGDTADFSNPYKDTLFDMFNLPGEELFKNPPPDWTFPKTLLAPYADSFFITLTPKVDLGAGFFDFVVFRATPPTALGAVHTTQGMINVARFFPYFTVRISAK